MTVIHKMNPNIDIAGNEDSNRRIYPMILKVLPFSPFSLEAITRSRSASKYVPVNRDSAQKTIVV